MTPDAGTFRIPSESRLAADWIPLPEFRSAYLLPYDTRRFPFAAWLCHHVFKVADLSRLHQDYARVKAARGYSTTLTYQDNLKLRKLMQALPDTSSFYKIYHDFVRQVLAPVFGCKLSYSRHPKMRVHLAGTGGVSKYHRDADVTGRPEQINVWLPFTPASSGNSLWIESDYDRGDYCPVTVNYGQALLFDGGLLSHGTTDNDTDVSRVSLDLRFTALSAAGQANVALILGNRPTPNYGRENSGSVIEEIRGTTPLPTTYGSTI
jgi:hypothetical protein